MAKFPFKGREGGIVLKNLAKIVKWGLSLVIAMVVKLPWTEQSGTRMAEALTSEVPLGSADSSLPGWSFVGGTSVETSLPSTEFDLNKDKLDSGLNDLFGRDDSGDGGSINLGGDSVSAEPSVADTDELQTFAVENTLPTEHVHAVASSSSFDTVTALEVASRSIPMQSVEPIWEQGIWGVIFGNKTMLDVYKPFGETLKRPADTSRPTSEFDVAMPASTKPRMFSELGLSFSDVVRDKPDVSWQEQRDSDLQRSVKFWMALVDRADPKCSLCCSIAELGSTSRIFTMFAHLFAGRAPITVRKRAYSIMRLCDYLESVGEVFPCNERLFYDFLCSEQHGNAPQSRMKGYMQSVNFVRFVMSVDELASLTTSARCKGACLGDHLQERIQASPLTVAELNRFHQLLRTGDDLWIKMFCGAVLMAVYCRSRWGDLMRAETVIEDCDKHGVLCYLEARTGRHKTMKSQMHRHQFLPMVAPAVGVDGSNWALAWLDVRRQLGVAWPPEGLVMPAPDRQGTPTGRPLETQECSAWLRKIVGTSVDSSSRRVSSHSLKSTMLSYAAKRGIGIPERLQLGYHTSNFQMGMVYSRDGAAASLMVLEKLISEIAQGKFDPDQTRSGRVVEASTVPAGANVVIEVKDEPETIEESEPEDLDSSSTSSEEPRPTQIKHFPVVQPTVAPDGFNLWQHKKLKTLHLMDVQNFKVLACGRSVGSLHEKLQEAPQFDTPLCSNCFNRKRS